MRTAGVFLLSVMCLVSGMPVMADTLPLTEEEALAQEIVPEQEETAGTMPETAPNPETAEEQTVESVSDSTEETREVPESTDDVSDAGMEEVQDADTADAGEPAEAAEAADAEEELLSSEEPLPVVEYKTHVQTDGWQDYVSNGAMSGTSGRAKRLEGICIRIPNRDDLGIEYRTHVQGIGWQEYTADDGMAGTSGQSKRLEAIQIRLTGDAAAEYDVYYCVHVQTYGWLNWAKNDQMAGTAGYSKRLEGIRILILPKDSPAPESESGAVSSYLDNNGNSTVSANTYKIIYNTHVQTYGWQDWVGDGALGGTSGKSKRLEGLHIRLQNQDAAGSVEYRTHVQGIGWQSWVKDGAMAGTSGQSKRLEALQIRLTGEMAGKYDVWYRTHVQSIGWMGWAKNGEEAGSQGYGYRMEAIEVKLLPKGSAAPGSTAKPFVKGRKIAGRLVYETTASKGKMIVLDPGHARGVPAGVEPVAPGSGATKLKGTYGTYGGASRTAEYELVLQVALELKNELVARGYSVLLTRENHETVISNIERAQIANAANADAYIRIHANGGGGPGTITMCTTPGNVHTQALYEKNNRLSQILLNTYCSVTGRRNLGVVYTDDLTGSNWSAVPTTLIELGFMTVPEEDLWMASAEGHRLMVKGMADAMDIYFG